MKGRKPTPTAKRILDGNPSKRPLPPDEPMPDLAAPEAPDWMSMEARTEWDRLVAEMLANGMMARMYLAPLAAYCVTFANWAEAERQMAATGGAVIHDEYGESKINPWARIVAQCVPMVTKLAAELGISPTSKTRVRSSVPVSKSPLALFVAESKGA